MGEIVTFYSYKGGVGRTMALANIAVLLSQWAYKVLIVDWDLEAPGLEFYFKGYLKDLKSVSQTEGMIDLLCQAFETSDSQANWKWQSLLHIISVPNSDTPLHFLSAGKKDDHYFGKVRGLDISSFYSERNGGLFLESLRDEWKQVYDFILLDSRAGITDIGGICTVQLPDLLVLLFTATEQSLEGTIKIAQKVNEGRQNLPVDRDTLLSLPIPSRFDAGEEFKISQKWLKRFAKELAPVYDYWLPAAIERVKFVEITKIPYVAYFSFGEKLPVVEQGTNDPQGLGYVYQTLSALVARKLGNVEELINNHSEFVRVASRQSSATVNQRTSALKKQPQEPLKFNGSIIMTMLGAEAVGKTTLLATMYAQLAILSDNRQQGFALEAQHDTGIALTKAHENLAKVIEQPAFTNTKQLLSGTEGIGEYNFNILFKGQEEVNLAIYDYAGGLMMAEEYSDSVEFRKILTHATVIMNVVDGAAMVEGNELYSDKIHKPLRLVELLRPVINSRRNYLILFVVTKCETWLKNDQGKKKLQDAFEKRHKIVLDLVKGNENAVGVLIPVRTLGCVEFKRIEKPETPDEKMIFTRNPSLDFSPEDVEQPLAYAMSFVLSQYLANSSWWKRFRRGKEYEEALQKLHSKCDNQFQTYGNFTLLEPWTK